LDGCGARRTQDPNVDGAVAASSDDKLRSSNYDRAHRTAQSIFLHMKFEGLTTDARCVHVVPLTTKKAMMGE
jgi:hypothetical protein